MYYTILGVPQKRTFPYYAKPQAHFEDNTELKFGMEVCVAYGLLIHNRTWER